MKSNIHKAIKSTVATLLYILSNWATISLLSLLVWGFVTQKLLRLPEENVLTLNMKILLSIEFLLVIASLLLSYFCIIKNHELKLPNKKVTGKLLWIISINPAPCFFKDKFANKYNIEEYVVEGYLKTLITFGYIVDNGYTPGFINGKKRKSYTVTNDGIKYLVKHKFIK